MKLIRTTLLLIGAMLLSITLANAQTSVVRQGSVIGWDQSVPPGDTILPPTYEYRLKVDNLPDVRITQTCVVSPTNAQLYACEAPLPAILTGGHILTIYARITVNGTNYAGPLSADLPVVSLLIEVPRNLRLVR